MRLCLFDSFADMIETIPTRAIIRTLERESRMLENDLACQRQVPLKEVESILSFCRFVEAVRTGTPVPTPAKSIPALQLEFYRQTILRLADAEELPFDAQAEFDNIFSNGCLKALHYAA